MKVKEFIKILSPCNPNAEIIEVNIYKTSNGEEAIDVKCGNKKDLDARNILRMGKVTVKAELDRYDISTMMHLCGSKLTDEQWNKMKGKECTIRDEDMGDQSVQMKLAFSAIAVSNLLKDE